MMFTRAIVRPPGSNFANGLTTSKLGPPVHRLAVAQHEAYCGALRACGLDLISLPADERYPDSTFVEDVAVLTARGAIITRPGAPSRLGETESIREVLAPLFPGCAAIEPPGTVDGGDVCQAEEHFFIGSSQRTNEEGAAQLRAHLEALGYTVRIVDVRSAGWLHLKSALAYLGDGRLAVVESLADDPACRDFDRIRIPAGEEPAANCVHVNDRVLIPQGASRFESVLRERGYSTVALAISEFHKMMGG
jgi:dimethylargininase